MKDTEYTLRLWERFVPMLQTPELYRDEVELAMTLLEVEAHGMGLDMEYLPKVTSEYGVKVMKGQAKLAVLTGKPHFNSNSPKQIMEALEARGLKAPNTQAATLRKLKDEFVDALLQYRSDQKVHSTYLTSMLADQRDGIIHPNFNTTKPRTGRMSSGAVDDD
jgi:DNA polymerase I-like protein with 3'-5' exonuclease and polymerase domains